MRLGDPRLPAGADVPRLIVALYDVLRPIIRTVNALSDARVLTGVGSPEGVVEAPVGTLYTRKDGGAGSTLYVKQSGTGSTGWSAK
ncbi:MAG: hypothetical protein LT106_18565 [Burkholderiaceae bacterium]|nr:hypothetical protein [Burkholderiaceae bacterium]